MQYRLSENSFARLQATLSTGASVRALDEAGSVRTAAGACQSGALMVESFNFEGFFSFFFFGFFRRLHLGG